MVWVIGMRARTAGVVTGNRQSRPISVSVKGKADHEH